LGLATSILLGRKSGFDDDPQLGGRDGSASSARRPYQKLICASAPRHFLYLCQICGFLFVFFCSLRVLRGKKKTPRPLMTTDEKAGGKDFSLRCLLLKI
jgi:hypothetical protein